MSSVKLAERSGGTGESFGQKRPPLYETIKHILREYPNGQIFKEIIQNADDARATEVKFFLDCRQLESLPCDRSQEHISQYTSPALLAYNDAPFKTEDWESIQRLQRSCKAKNPYKVGKFGIGFNSVYHITDLPVILSQNFCGFLEPQEEVWRGESGKGFYLEALNRTYPNVLKPFDNICGFARSHATFYNKTLLRFPLRIKTSKLSSDLYTIDKLRALIQSLKEEAKYLLLFLRSVTSIEVLEINNDDLNVLNPRCIFKAKIDSQEQIMLQKQRLIGKIESCFKFPFTGICHEPIKDTANFSITIICDDHKHDCHKWLVVNRIGSNEKSVMELAKEQHVLPWVGTAIEINNNEEMASNGHIFCVLPLPMEDRAPLSVHVNGTFAISSNRQSLKWESQEQKDDKETKWNGMLVEKCLSKCLLDLVKNLIELYKNNPAIVYGCWPDVTIVSGTPWRGVLEPFYQSLLMSNEVVYTLRGGGRWIGVKDGVYINNRECVPQSVINAMISCNVNIVELTENIQKALSQYYVGSCITTLDPQVTRSHLNSNLHSYKDMSLNEKLGILDYCLSDGTKSYNYLNDLELLPMANDSFKQFCKKPPKKATFDYAYVCSEEFPLSLLPGLEHILVSVYDSNKEVHEKLVSVAMSGLTNVRVLNVPFVAELISHCDTSQWSERQLEHFWEWLKKYQLNKFHQNKIVPVSSLSCGFDIKPLSKQNGVVYISQDSNPSKILISGLYKCGIKFADANRFPYLSHHQISKYLYEFKADDILSAMETSNLIHVNISAKEAEAIQNFICSCSKLTQSKGEAIRNLPIFSTIQKNVICSINSIKTTNYKNKAICVKLSGLRENLIPNNPLLINGNTNNSSLLSLLHSQHLIVDMSTTDYLLEIAFNQIKRKSFGNENVVDFMKDVLNIFPTFQNSSNFTKLSNALSSLPFINVGDDSNYIFCAPQNLFDPRDELVLKLFHGQSKFLTPDFIPCISILKQHLKTINSVNAPDICKVIESIKQQQSNSLSNATSYTKARAVLDYLNKYPETLNQKKLSEILHSKPRSWLPVVKNPPQSYPSCLSWKGSTHYPSLRSTTPLFALSASVESHPIPVIGGSQIIFIENVQDHIAKCICSPPHILIQAVVSHFKCIIDNEKTIPSETLEQLSSQTYSYLTKYIDYVNTSVFDETDRWIWMESSSTFVSSNQVIIGSSSSFRTNLEPLLFVLPLKWKSYYSPLFIKLGVAKEMTTEQVVSIFHTLKNSSNKMASNEAWSVVVALLNWLAENSSSIMHEAVLVPIESDSEYPDLQPIDTVAYTDNEMLKDIANLCDEDFSLIHWKVAHLGAPLGVSPLSDHLDITEDAFEDAGQCEPLITRLVNILKEYKDGLTIIKEMIQNADDAEATEVNILYDSRSHTTQNLLFKGMGESHGPALIVHNNSTFSDEDFINITKLAGATKSNKPLKIGKFGVGFCSVYHITDVPSFISGEWLYIFDPTLQYLRGIIRNENQPGKKVKYLSNFISKSKQLAPYENIFNFQSSEVYNGTMFRFPFRCHPSQISSTLYNDHLVSELKEDLIQNGSKLLLFLQNVKRITFSTRCTDNTVEELSIQCFTDGDIKKCVTSVLSSEPITEYWLISSHTMNFDTKNGIQPGTGSVACELKSVDGGAFECKEYYNGSLFCFLPLSMPSTGLPVHVNGNFAVMSNRSGIWTSTSRLPSDFRELWNLTLLRMVIPQAYCNLLLKLKSLSLSGKVRLYTFHSLWPLDVKLQVKYPWVILTSELYKMLLKEELFHSQSTDKWLMLSKCKFLSPMLFIGKDIINDDGTCINEAVMHLKLPVVSLPSTYWEQLKICSDMLMDQEMFIRHFQSNINSFKTNIEIRNQVLLHMLSWIVTINKDSKLIELIKAFPCIPCSPDGVKLKSVHELLDPTLFNEMFDSSDGMFPVSSFMMNKYIYQAMISLGLLQSDLPPEILVKCAESVQVIFNKDKERGIERIKLLIDYIKEDKSDLCSLIRNIPFLPVLPKPHNFILPWKGDGYDLLPPSQVIAVTSFDNLHKCSVTVGSQKAIVNTNREGGCGSISCAVLSLLNIPTVPSLDDVLNHFQCLINLIKMKKSKSPDKLQVDIICRNVYEFLDWSLINSDALVISHGRYYSLDIPVAYTYSLNSKEKISKFSSKPFIWTGEVFVVPSDVSKQWKRNGPCLYRLPDMMSERKALLEALNIKNKFDAQKLLCIFKHLHESYTSQVLPSDFHNLCDSIITELNSLSNEELNEVIKNKVIYLVDEKYVIQLSSDLFYNDTQWLAQPTNATLQYVHSQLLRAVAVKLGVTPTSTSFLERHTASSHFQGVPFGQKEELTERIKNILNDYPFDITFIKELIQNADDAKATKMYVILDKRQHGTERVISEKWKELQCPALLVWDNKNFTDEDIKGIQRLGVGSKRDDDESIGQFGIGFNVVYHVTDCPSFITRGNTLCVFDPHCHYVPGADSQCPGRQYNINKSFWESMPDMHTAFLQDDLPNKPSGLDSGVLFRFPLRFTQKLVSQSKLINDSVNAKPLTPDKMEEYLKEWISSIKEALLFLNNLTLFEVYIIDEFCKYTKIKSFSVVLKDGDNKERNRFKELCSKFIVKRECTPIIYPLTIETNNSKEKWLVQQGVGDISDPSKSWEYINKTMPKHGIAAPLTNRQDFIGKVFRFLPLPVSTNLPVHINGQFFLSSDRQSLWNNSTKYSDSKTRWNTNLIEAIACSYAEFLCKAKEYYISQEDEYDNTDIFCTAMNEYYNLFPFVNAMQRQEIEKRGFIRTDWNCIGQMVYKQLWSINADILVCEVYQSTSAINAHWHKLRVDVQLQCFEQAYFLPTAGLGDDLKSVLRDIGMKLTSAPLILYKLFKDLEFEVAIINSTSVFQYYTQCHQEIIEKIPCSIEDTPFKNAENFCAFLSYILVKLNEDDSHYTFPCEYDSTIPLLLTTDSKLRGIENVLKSEYYHLFEKSSFKFLHPTVIERCPKLSFLNDTSLKDINEIMKINYPLLGISCEAYNKNQQIISDETLKGLWKCLQNDPVFHAYETDIINAWTLIPSCDGKLFSGSSHILPIIAESFVHEFQSVFDLLTFLGLPLCNSAISDHVKTYCLQIDRDHVKILLALYNYNRQYKIGPLFNKFAIHGTLLNYFGKIDFRNDPQSLEYIKHLPLFLTITGERTSIFGKTLYSWPLPNVCAVGMDKWKFANAVVFFEYYGEWRLLCPNIETLGGENIDLKSVYLKMLFPIFVNLTAAERHNHLQYIKDYIYSDMQYKISNGNKHAKKFFDNLKNLKCIESRNNKLLTISSFCHHKMKVFTFFEKQYEFVPKEYQAGNWIEFLCDLGLRQTLTINEFKRSCQLISKSHHKNIQGASEVLLDYLFSESARSWHSNQRALSEIGDICFVSVDPLTNYRWIKEPCPSPLYFQKQQIGLTKLNESVISDNAAIIWTVKPVVCLPHSLSSCDDMLFHLGVTVRPTIEDVYKNLKNISSCSNTELATCKKNDQIILESVISKNLNFLFENKATELLLKLSNIPCIPVPVNSTPEMVQLVLVKPIQVVRHISKEDEIFFPYIHQVPSFMNTINDDDLGLLRISKYIEVDTLQRMLQSMHDKGVKLDGKDVNCVRNAILKIKELCHQHSKVIGPLYYPNENLVLKRTTDLVFIDSPRYISIKSNLSNFLFLLPSISNCSDHELLEYDICLKLPEDIRPKRLSLVCTELLRRTIYSNDDCALSIHFNKLKSMVPYIEETLSKVLINENGSKLLSSYFVQLICHMQIKVVKYLTCEVKLECVTLGDVNVPYLIECNETEDIPVLYVDYDTSPNQLNDMYGTLAHSICIEIARKHNEDPTVYLNAASVISKFLEITAPQDLKEICKIYKLDPPNDINFINDVPALGHKIPNDYVALIYNADIDYNDFQPEEWVGYAVKEDCIIYAIILYPANDENCSLMRKYCIHDGENEQTVSVIDLYALKVNSSLTATKNEDLLVENAYHELIKIEKLEKESELFTKATNRLYIKYHPDRVSPNRHDLYTKVYKYLSRQIDRLTLGLAVEKPSETAPDDVPPTSRVIDTLSRMLNWIIRTYKESKEAGRQINLIQPQGDKVEGRKWLRQAKSDMETMNDLLRLNKPHHCCHIIFLAHQTCEKALKGGMYAHFGINLDIHTHKLSHYANALSSRVGELAQHLDFVKIMDSESYYSKTRYPNQFKPSCPPVEKYRDISKARMIAKEAKEVYTLISNTI